MKDSSDTALIPCSFVVRVKSADGQTYIIKSSKVHKPFPAYLQIMMDVMVWWVEVRRTLGNRDYIVESAPMEVKLPGYGWTESVPFDEAEDEDEDD